MRRFYVFSLLLGDINWSREDNIKLRQERSPEPTSANLPSDSLGLSVIII